MKNKTAWIFTLAFLLAACSHKDKPGNSAPSQSAVSAPHDSASPESVAVSFYRAYLGGVSPMAFDSLMAENVTPERIRLVNWLARCSDVEVENDDSVPPDDPLCKIPEKDSVLFDSAFSAYDSQQDYFYKSTDYQSSWEDHVKITGKAIRDSSASVHILLGPLPNTIGLDITLKRKSGRWKIDEVVRKSYPH